MKFIWILTLSFALVLGAKAQDANGKRAAVEEMLKVLNLEKNMSAMMSQMDKVMESAMNQSLNGKELSEADSAELKKVRTGIMEGIKEELTWDKLKGDYIEIFAEIYTPEEIQGITDFYKSPLGQALIAKQPLAMQKAMMLMQKKMGPMMERMKQSVDKAVGERKK